MQGGSLGQRRFNASVAAQPRLGKAHALSQLQTHFSELCSPFCRESKPVAEAWQGQEQSEAEALRCRCRISVLMQRACDAMHAQNAQHMPLEAQLQLLSVLQVRSHGFCHAAIPLPSHDAALHCVASCFDDIQSIHVRPSYACCHHI